MISHIFKPFCLMSHKHHKRSSVPIPFPRKESKTPVGPNEPGKNRECVAQPIIWVGFTDLRCKVYKDNKIAYNFIKGLRFEEYDEDFTQWKLF